MGFSFFLSIMRLIITDEIIDSGGSFNRPHAQICFDISDVFSCSEIVTDSV